MTLAAGAAPIRPLRVLHLRDSVRLCGPGKIIRDCMRVNDDPGVEFALAAFGSLEKNLFLAAMRPIVPVFGVPRRKRHAHAAVAGVEQLIRALRVDVLHTHDFKANAIGFVAARRTGVPVVATVHGRITNGLKAKVYCSLDNVLLRHFDLVLAVSRKMEQALAGLGVPAGRLHLARNSIIVADHPFRLRSSRLREEGLIGPDDVVIGHVGRVSREKGQLALVEAVAELRAEFPRVRLLLAGDGPDLAHVRRSVAHLGLEGRVVELGYRPDIENVYGALDLLVLNSTTEGLPNVVLEAMCFGVPVVATAVGGTPELVEDGVTGLLVPAGDRAALVEAIRRALRDRAASAARAERARALVEREFDMRGLARRINGLYRALLARRAPVRHVLAG